ncbi:MAG: NAD(P)H-dependent oxidoreductase [Planctomycetes bacterium]|nr:NAD(P)H-dependent oxidoreductase [Planctomycetota bacterium]
MTKVRVVLVMGSLNEESATSAMIQFVKARLEALEAQVDLIDLREAELPLFQPKIAKEVPAYRDMEPLVREADCFVLGSPDYHGMPSGAMKNFLDYFWREFSGKLFGYVCASDEKGLTPMDAMRVAIRQCYGWSLPYGVSGVEGSDVRPEGEVVSSTLTDRLTMLAHDLVNYGGVIRERRERDLDGDHPTFMANLRSRA